MSSRGFRFVHATCLCLDEHLVGTGPLSPEDRELAEDATFHAWNGIVETCIASQADFLLLTGNSFNARTDSLRARLALEKGFETLSAQRISIFVVPGELDPYPAWKRLDQLLPNVTILSDQDHEPVAVMQDKRVLASIFVIPKSHGKKHRSFDSDSSLFDRHQTPFRIGVIPAGSLSFSQQGDPTPLVEAAQRAGMNYIALGEGSPVREFYEGGLIHNPGCAQSLSVHVTGSRGCSVVNVTAHGEITVDAVAVAPIRWEDISLTANRQSNWNDLAETMALSLMERVADNDEQLWMVTWQLSGEGTVFDALKDPVGQRKLWEMVETELDGESEIRRVHRLRLVGQNKPVSSPPPRTALFQDFVQMLAETQQTSVPSVQEELLESSGLQGKDLQLMKEILQSLQPLRVIRRAEQLAAACLE